MDEAETARNIYYGRLEHEANLNLQLQAARVALQASTLYRDSIVTPGWAEAVNYYGIAALGATLLAVAPVGLLGGGMVYAGLALTGYGVAGSAAYTTQALSRTFSVPLGNADMGQRFDQYAPHMPEREGAVMEDWAYEKARDHIIERFLKDLGAATKQEVPSLPTKIEPWREYLKKEIERLENEIKAIDKQMQDEHPSLNPSKQENNKTTPPPIKKQVIPSRLGNDRNGHGQETGGTYAGPDTAGPDISNTV